jgi:uncharacterized protein YoaH (UPF0181 family)
LLFSHYGPVTDVDNVLDASEAELHYWVETATEAYTAGMDIEHAIALVAEKDRERHPAFYETDEVNDKFEELSSLGANVQGIYRWLAKRDTTSDPTDKHHSCASGLAHRELRVRIAGPQPIGRPHQ